MIGKEIMGYRVDEKIGSGGFGTVYKVSKTNAAGTYVRALKHITLPTKKQYASVLNSMGGDYAKADNYFSSVLNDIVGEIRILSALSDGGIQNIVRYYENDIVQTQSPKTYDIYILMEYLTPFPDYFENRSYTVGDVIRLGKDILKALVSCHEKNIIHRDIKDDNIFVSSDGVYKLGDFGVSKALKDKSRAESVKGTPNFIAPEVYLGKEKYDNTVDVYSLGIVLYKLLNKSRYPFLPAFPAPYSTEDENAAFEARISGQIPELPSDAQNQLGKAVMKAIMPRAQRYDSASEFLAALESAEKTLSAAELSAVVNIVIPTASSNEKSASFGPSAQNNHFDETVAWNGFSTMEKTIVPETDKHLFDTFAAPPPITGAPSQNGYVPPQNSYAPPQNSYAPPQNGYAPPQNGYAPPQNGYAPPQNGYAPPQNGYAPPQNGYAPPQNGYAPYSNYSNPSAGAGYRATSYGDSVDGSAPPKVSAVRKKDLSWLIYLTPVFIAIVYIVMYVFVLPRFVFNTAVGLLEWLFKNPDKILDALKQPSTFLNPIYLVIAIKIMGWVLVSGFITSLFWVGRTLHNKKPPISMNAMMLGNEAYISAMDIYEQMKLISSTDVTLAKKAVYSVCERLKNESDFGSGSSSVINCENEIASLLRSIEGNIPALYDKNSAEAATKNIEMLCQRILSKLKVRIELKKK